VLRGVLDEEESRLLIISPRGEQTAEGPCLGLGRTLLELVRAMGPMGRAIWLPKPPQREELHHATRPKPDIRACEGQSSGFDIRAHRAPWPVHRSLGASSSARGAGNKEADREQRADCCAGHSLIFQHAHDTRLARPDHSASPRASPSPLQSHSPAARVSSNSRALCTTFSPMNQRPTQATMSLVSRPTCSSLVPSWKTQENKRECGQQTMARPRNPKTPAS
jgi:hypothetical protein